MSQKTEITKIKQTGYLISGFGVVISNIGMVRNWSITPIILLITMYFLAGSLWFPILIKPFYNFLFKMRNALLKFRK